MTRTNRHPRRTLAAALAAAVVSAIAAAPVHAGTYTVQSCGTTGSTDGWAVVNTVSSSMQTSSNCGGTSAGDGLRVADILPSPDVIGTSTTAWRFTPPAGTTITKVVMRDFVKKYDNNWIVGMRVPSGPNANIYDNCVTDGGGFCQFAGQFDVAINDIDTPYVEWGAFCQPVSPATGCRTGFSLNEVQTDLYRVTLTVKDPTAPGSASVSGVPSGWVRSLSATVAGQDAGGGVASVQLRAGGELLGSTASSCSYVLARPCPTSVSAAVGANLSSLGDGVHQVFGRAIDAGGEFTDSSTSTLRVDRTAPDAPSGIGGDTGWSSSAGASLSVPIPAQAFAPISLLRTELCAPGCGGSSTSNVTGSPQTLNVASLPEGTSTVRVGFNDEAGNEGASTDVTVRRDRTAPTAALSAFSEVAFEGDRLNPVASGEDALSGIDTVTREVQVDGGAWAASPADGVVAELGRTYRFRAIARDLAGNTATAETATATVRARPQQPEPTPTPAPTATPVATPAPTATPGPVPTATPTPVPAAKPTVRVSSLSARRARDGRVTVRLRGTHSERSGRARVRLQLGKRVVTRTIRAARGKLALDLGVRATGTRVTVRVVAVGGTRSVTRKVTVKR